MEPFFSVLLSWAFLGQSQSPAVLASLLPIVGGVAMASVSEVHTATLATLLTWDPSTSMLICRDPH